MQLQGFSMLRRFFKNSKGSTLIELLIATMVVGLMLTAIAISLTYSIQREAMSRYKDAATSLAIEITEFLMVRRAQLGWNGFTDSSIGYPSGTYCFTPATPPTLVPRGGYACPVVTRMGMSFVPEVAITTLASTKLSAIITISWDGGGATANTYQLTQDYYEREY